MERERAKPIEVAAKAIRPLIMSQWRGTPDVVAKACWDTWVSHGFITIEGLLAMKAEQEAGK